MNIQIFHKEHIRIIRRYLAGEATEKEKDFLESYYDCFEKEPDILDDLSPAEKSTLKNQMQQFILNRIEKPVIPVIPLWKRVGRIAALVVLLLSIALLTRNFFSSDQSENDKDVIREITAEVGTQKNIYLSDGSSVLLKEGSSIKYKNIFRDSVREVYLTGEAFFEVTPDDTKPFIVYSGKIRTWVLGTAFTIKAYPGQEEILVRVVRGKVRVDAPSEDEPEMQKVKESIILIPDQEISYNITTGQFKHNDLQINPAPQQKPSEYTMDNLTMAQAAKIISERFKKEVIFDNPALINSRITVSFFEKDPLDEVLTVICGVSKFNYKIERDTIIIK
ncbi:MAG: FecR family protein [Bacteroidales bacterium]|nr:FecR family protein [Bacteroidales bacterium]